MGRSESNLRLNQIDTLWSVVRRAHADPSETAQTARHALLERYGGAIRRYLAGALRDAHAADDLFQDFAYRFLHGDLRNADPARGRFRDFVKGVLFHLVANYHNNRARQPVSLALEQFEPGAECSLAAEREEAFRVSWREELLARTWEELRGQVPLYYTVLRFRADHPDLSSAQMAEQLSGSLGKPITAAGVRKTLERARDRFADLLLAQIIEAVDDPSRERLEEELLELGLFDQCRAALARRCGSEGGSSFRDPPDP
jgi:RNA polymerase sigma-70 factor (ECF subfamily)